ncbi:glutamine--fructose-6-phosphate transaminase (isomerizing) [Sphingomonas daechungensis]|uniref:glutamine--fructose-6-phosphate transaminase (isomerizing) n=1 Tax=Sphingomonas daechungensis TaxID=1176646 RepID=UPI003782E85F
MCGIVGIVGKRPAVGRLVDGLTRLEYRGYDSSGVATLVDGRIERRRAEGRISRLEELLARDPLPGTTGIGHTRWATHGAPNETNAHPHATERVAVVHNGIIENFAELKAELEAKGRKFETDTDTEVVAHLLTVLLAEGMTPEAAMAAGLKRLHGAFALAVIVAGRPDLLLAARRGSPLAVGYGDGEMFVGSDALALAPLTRRISYLDDGDWVVAGADGAQVFDANANKVERAIKETAMSGALIGKGNFQHFMQKEIFEQPAVIGDTLRSYVNPATRYVSLPKMPVDLSSLPRVQIVACGTSYYAASTGRYWIERLARLPCDVDIASEFRYRDPILEKGGLSLFVSQSGETIDTLSALRHAKEKGQKIASIVNVPESSMARESDVVLATHAGPEIGVASTKAFTTQLSVLASFAFAAARERGTLDAAQLRHLANAIYEVPEKASAVLATDEKIRAAAEVVARARDVLFLGRGTSFPIAMEGALKLKEISYIHAEGYAAGEMKHGPIALIASDVPVIILAPTDEWFEKTASNVQEVRARGGQVILFADRKGIDKLGGLAVAAIELPESDPFVTPILYSIPVQLLAYYVALLRGTDVDKPRNLAKSVTVE